MNNVAESKRERFVRIAEARTNKMLHMLKLLGNCANRRVYDYNDEDVGKIFSAIEKELRQARQCFSNAEGKESKFRLN